VLQRAQRDREDLHDSPEMNKAVEGLWESIQAVKDETDLDRIRGIEGTAASVYFGVFDLLVSANKEHFFFKERSRRPPLDNMNALLSFLYTLLVHDAESALEGVGLDPAVGFLHRDRPGRPSLALDLMEEFRAYLADRLALSLINRQQIKPDGFTRSESGAVVMTDETRKEVLTAWQKRKQEEITHLFLQEPVPLGLLPHVQAMLLSRHLRGDLEGYPPFLWH
jgi:CRISPR-associated protein Cas1